MRAGGFAAGLPWRAAMAGLLAAALLLALYFGLLGLVSGWPSTLEQFAQFWPYVAALAAGFGVQVALFAYLRRLLLGAKAHGVVAASGTASAAAMVSCCTHYLANLLPVLGATGLVTFATQYQVQLFWVGIAFNAAGIAYIGRRVAAARRDHIQCMAAA